MTAEGSPPRAGLALFTVVAISGASVLAIEILGTRILAPFYGASLFLWSALISVTLAALSVGYAVGGRWADRGSSGARLALLLAAAGLWLLTIPWAAHPLLAASERLGLRAAVLATAFLLFFVPLTLLGMVTPLAIRRRTSHLESLGRVAGELFAVSTMASVAAAIAVGFWLIPAIGVARLTLGVGSALLVAAVLAWFEGLRAPLGRGAGLLLAGFAAVGLLRVPLPEARAAGLRYLGQSPYAEIRVLDEGNARYFVIDGGVHTIVRPGTWDPLHEYVVVTELAKELFRRPGRLLLVGLGGGAVAKSFTRGGWRVDAVEIDPLVPRVASDYFGLRPLDAKIHLMDARSFLARDSSRYDLIVLDAFGSSSIPFHLVTTEAFGLVRARLADGGVVALNVEAVGWKDPLVASVAATLRTRFSNVVALPIAEPPDQLGNLILFASDRVLEIPDEALGDPASDVADPIDHWRILQRAHAWDNRFEPDIQGVAPLTDDRNPVDLRAEAINRVARGKLHERFRKQGGSW